MHIRPESKVFGDVKCGLNPIGMAGVSPLILGVINLSLDRGLQPRQCTQKRGLANTIGAAQD